MPAQTAVGIFRPGLYKTDCDACDVCFNEVEGLADATVTAQKILSCVARAGERFGGEHIVDVLLGAKTERIRTWDHEKLSTYGLMKGTDRKSLTNMIYQLIDADLLERTSDERPVLGSIELPGKCYAANVQCDWWRQRKKSKRLASMKCPGRTSTPAYLNTCAICAVKSRARAMSRPMSSSAMPPCAIWRGAPQLARGAPQRARRRRKKTRRSRPALRGRNQTLLSEKRPHDGDRSHGATPLIRLFLLRDEATL